MRRASSELLGSVAVFLVYQIVNLGSPGALLAQSRAATPHGDASALAAAPAPSKARRARAAGPVLGRGNGILKTYGQFPLSFEPNRGQTDSQVKFLSRAPGYTLFLTANEAVLRLRASKSRVESQASKAASEIRLPTPDSRPPAVLRMTLAGGNRAPEMAGIEELPGKSNYFIGRDPEKWQTGIPNYRKVAVLNVYPGIDLVYYGNQRQLEYDFTVAPGADPRTIRLAFEVDNSKSEKQKSKIDSAQVDTNGDLVIAMGGGELRFHKPVMYQELAVNSPQLAASDLRTAASRANHQSAISDRQFVDGRYVLHAANPKSKIENPKYEIAFEIASYDRSRPLIIDPVLAYSTYLGGNAPGTPGTGLDAANGIAIDSTGSAFLVGETDSTDFPTEHALQPETGGPFDFPDDAFVSKISPDGQTLVYSTYLGGSRQDRGAAIAVDTFGSAYVTGTTISPDFPASFGAADPTCGNDGQCDATYHNGLVTTDAFITKLNPEGSAIEYSSFFSHRGPLLVDSNGNPVLDGTGNFQYTGANDRGFGIAVDNNRYAYVTGMTDVATPAQLVGPGGDIDAWVVKVDPSGANFLNPTDIGGSGKDEGLTVAADNAGNAYISGFTLSPDFPTTPSAFQLALAGTADAFIAKLNTNVGATLPATLSYSTFLGGSGNDSCCGPDLSHPGKGIALDISGKVYVTGVTNSRATTLGFPIPGGPYQPDCSLNGLDNCDGDAFVAKIDTAQSGSSSLLYFTYLGGSSADGGAGIAVDISGNAYVTGITNSSNFPIAPTDGVVFQRYYGGGNADAFVTQLNATGTALVYSSFLGGSNTEDGRGIAVDTRIPASAFVAGQTCSTDFPTARPLQESSAGNCDAFASKVIVGPDIAISPAALSFPSQDVGTTSSPQSITVTSNGDSPLIISQISISGEFAETDDCSGRTLKEGVESCTISVTFSPTTTGPKSGTVTITDNALGSPHTVPLSGGTAGVTGDYALSVDPTSVSVVAGGATTVTLAITPAAGFTGKVTLACAGAPSQAVCSVNPASVTLDGANPSEVAVTIQTTARVMAPPVSGPGMPLGPQGLRWLPWLLGMMLLVTAWAAGRKRPMWILAAAMFMLVVWTACGGGGQVGVPHGTPAGVYKVTLSGVSGSTAKTATLTLTVN